MDADNSQCRIEVSLLLGGAFLWTCMIFMSRDEHHCAAVNRMCEKWRSLFGTGEFLALF